MLERDVRGGCRNLSRCVRGASSIEHALFGGVIAIALLGGLTMTRQMMQDSYRCIASDLLTLSGGPCEISMNGAGSLTLAASRAQSDIPAGSRILMGGVFVDRDGAAGYAASLDPPSEPGFVWRATMTNVGTGRMASTEAMPAAGAFEIGLDVLALIGPGAPALAIPSGMKAVVYLVRDGDGVPRPYYAAKPV